MKAEGFNEAETRKKETAATAETLVEKDPLAGAVLDGRYAIKRKLGQGGFGAVYLASDEKMMSRPVVAKILHVEKVGDDWSLKKFKQEVEAMVRIDHPSIVGVLDSGQLPDGKPYIVMQYVDGVSLRSQINSEGMDFGRAANIVRQIGKALTAAHDRGILHRDLKPENIMLQKLDDGDEQVKIIDFGIAKVKDSMVSMSTASNVTVGTAAYMSPEQLCAGNVTATSDVYSFGIIAYEMITGRRPANPDSPYQLLEIQRSGVRIKPTDLRPSLNAAAEAIILKALSFQSEDRFERARDFGDLLSEALLEAGGHTRVKPQVSAASDEDGRSLETAHVLFMDIVGYSKLRIDQQRESIRKLQEIVSATDECRRAQMSRNLIRLPTGDGISLVFFADPESPVRCAIEISRALRKESEISLRMGVHSGLVYRIADINTNMNVAGGGINIAQRVMDCGDGGHILLSKRVADDLGELTRWSDNLHDLGNAQVKHGVKIHVFNLWGDDFGNPAPPVKFATVAKAPSFFKRAPVMLAGGLVILALAIAGAWVALRPKAKLSSPPTNTATATVAGPEQSLTYWLTVQKMLNQKPLGQPIDSAGNIIFGNGWKFRFNFRPMQSGALYLLNIGPGKTGQPEYNILFPLPPIDPLNTKLEVKLDARLAANQTMQSGWLQFVEHTGEEELLVIWSNQPIPELDTIFNQAAGNKKDPGMVTDGSQIALIETYRKKYDPKHLEKTDDLSKKLTSLKGWGSVIVNVVKLQHEDV